MAPAEGARETASGLCYHPRARRLAGTLRMPNIQQQKKRVRIASRQRLENLRYRSTVKTLQRHLRDATAEGQADAIAEAHRELVKTLDRAVSRGALHKNTAARKKSQAAKLVAGV